MKLYPIECGNFKLDGGAMFGVVPKSLWQRTNPADANNMIELAMRALLIEDGNRLILVDCGMGNKQSEKFFGFYSLWGDFSLDKSLKAHGFRKEDITDVFLTHLHFDHCGGAIAYNAEGKPQAAFPNARFWSNPDHWKWATEPNPREKASFLKENILPIEESGQLNHVEVPPHGNIGNCDELGLEILFVNGHTDKQMLPMIKYKGQKLVFAADLIPTVGHIPLVYVMGYDTRPLLTIDEKNHFLNQAVEEDFLLFFEHDAHNTLARLQHTEKGVRLKETYSWNEVFGD